MTHTRAHGWQAAQAKRRGETWIQCTDCSTHSRPHRRYQAEPQVDEDITPWRLLGLVVFVLVMMATLVYALPILLIGLFPAVSA